MNTWNCIIIILCALILTNLGFFAGQQSNRDIVIERQLALDELSNHLSQCEKMLLNIDCEERVDLSDMVNRRFAEVHKYQPQNCSLVNELEGTNFTCSDDWYYNCVNYTIDLAIVRTLLGWETFGYYNYNVTAENGTRAAHAYILTAVEPQTGKLVEIKKG